METPEHTHSLQLSNQIDELSRLAETIDQLQVQWQLPVSLVMPLNLALEEAFTNVVNYAYDDDKQHLIELEFSLSGDTLTVSIRDDGRAWDPTQKEDPDVSLPAGDRPIGGLGIFLIKKLMDKVHYQRIENKNQLTLTKHISQ